MPRFVLAVLLVVAFSISSAAGSADAVPTSDPSAVSSPLASSAAGWTEADADPVDGGEGVSAAAGATGPVGRRADDAEGGPQDGVLISEIANGGSRSDSDTFVELRNWGDEPVDLDGWRLYRCSSVGLRANSGAMESSLDGRSLEPGELLTISRVGLPGDLHVTQPYSSRGVGFWLEDGEGRLRDRIGLYPNEPWPTQSECSPLDARGASVNLPNSLDFAADESWQRVGTTGDPASDFVVARSTPNAPDATVASPRANAADRKVRISELAAEGPGGDSDDVVELRNTGLRSVEIGGWKLYRCTSAGRLRSDQLQADIPDGTRLAPGERWLLGGPGYEGTGSAAPDARAATSLADVEFGVLLRDGDGRLVDRVAVSSYRDSACQEGDAKLPAVLDPVAGESWQLTPAEEWIIAPRTPGAANASTENAVVDPGFAYGHTRGVAISELATDPDPSLLAPGMRQRNFIELANYGADAVDIGGWTLRRCEADGVRSRELQATVPTGTTVEPGATWLAARSGTDEAAGADAVYPTSLHFLGAGVWVADRSGRRVDSVGVYGRNEMDDSLLAASPCSKGIPLTTFQPDRLRGQSFQRVGFSGVDADDFGVAAASPGSLRPLHADAVSRLADRASLRGRSPASAAAPAPATAGTGSGTDSGVSPAAWSSGSSSSLRSAPLLEAWSGSSSGPLTTLAAPGEIALDAVSPAPATDSGYGFPYQRLVLDGSDLGPGSRIDWSGTTTGRGELQLSVWDPEASRWRLLDAAADASGSGAEIVLGGVLRDAESGDRVVLLVQEGPRTEPTVAAERDGQLQDPADYDLAISHLTDTQYLTESYPEVYAGMVDWIRDSADDRKIAFATHTGDLVQNWVDPDQGQDRARREFERASDIQAVLDDAGVPNSVLPGNHDSKRGVDHALFDEYFGPERYRDQPWFGGTIAPDDNSANYSLFERAGAPFLMLSLPYAYGEREIAWAEAVVAAHPDRNVVLSTHEHLSPKTQTDAAHRSSSSRWVSRAQELWERVVAPNRNVIVVLSGHFHGIGSIVTEDAGGLPGHDVVELLADYQEFRTHTGERATGFQRLLQVDLAGGTIAVDTFSTRLAASSSAAYDYEQFLPDNGGVSTPSNDRPWNIVADGLQDRYDAADDEFTVSVAFQFAKSVATRGVTVSAAAPASAG